MRVIFWMCISFLVSNCILIARMRCKERVDMYFTVTISR